MITVGVSTLKLSVGQFKAQVIEAQSADVGALQAGTAAVSDVLDLTGAEVRGFNPVIGSYNNPALDTTVTLTTGNDPAATVSWGNFAARAALDVRIEDPTGTIDEEADIDHTIIEDPNNPGQRMFEFSWVNDPGNDVDLNVRVSKFI